jgi:hypothetical protein
MGKRLSLEILNPRGETEITYHKPADRVSDLNGKTIGVIDNKKAGSREFLNIIKRLLQETYADLKFVDLSKNFNEQHRMEKYSDSLMGIDAAIYSTGD